MVGVAGKSKGCATCRRRKIRCDLQKPGCQNCNKSGRICEGYERYPVFLNRTPEGISKRSRLEEAKTGPCQAAPLQQHFVSHSPARRTLNEAQIISWFWEHYAPPLRPADARQGYAGWLYYAISIPNPPPALRQSLLALAVTRYGRATGDSALFQQGRLIYSSALQVLQQVLYGEETTWADETLASVRSMVLYEFLESTSEDPTAWYSHLDGITRLLEARGPRRHTADMPRAVLEDIRYPLIMKAIMQRTSSVFGEQHWLEEPWQDQKGIDQVVFDHGFLLASLIERAERLRTCPPGTMESLTATLRLLQECNGLYRSLQDLYHDKLSDLPVEAWRRAERLILVLNLYTLQLLITTVMDPLCKGIQAARSFVPPATGGAMDQAVMQAKGYIANQEAVARKIKDGIRLSLDESLGQFGPSRTIFPLNMLLFYYRHSKNDFTEVAAMKRMVGQENELKFASNLNRGKSIIPHIMRNGIPLTKPENAALG